MKLHLVGRGSWLLGDVWVMQGWGWCQEHKYNPGWRQPLPGIATKLCSSCLRFIMSLHSWMSSILQKQKKHGQTCKPHSVLMGLARSHLTLTCQPARGPWHSLLTQFNREKKAFNTKCPLNPSVPYCTYCSKSLHQGKGEVRISREPGKGQQRVMHYLAQPGQGLYSTTSFLCELVIQL